MKFLSCLWNSGQGQESSPSADPTRVNGHSLNLDTCVLWTVGHDDQKDRISKAAKMSFFRECQHFHFEIG